MAQNQNSPGRARNAAEKSGHFTALGGAEKIRETGETSRTRAGPDGPDAAAVGETFMGPKGDPAEGKRR